MRFLCRVFIPSEPQVSRESFISSCRFHKGNTLFNPNPVNKNNTFDNFVRGNCNDMAFEAALAVAKFCRRARYGLFFL
ncbi:MAG: DnaA ATPase domain-containing protein [Dialister sp.]